MKANKSGYSLAEIIVVVAIMGILIVLGGVAFASARTKARDARRMSDINQIGRFLSSGCIVPEHGPGEYDLNELIHEFKVKYPKYANLIPPNINDPKTGSDQISNYKYIVTDNNKCVLFANLENKDEMITLPNLKEPTPGGGNGILSANNAGWNGSNKFFQISN